MTHAELIAEIRKPLPIYVDVEAANVWMRVRAVKADIIDYLSQDPDATAEWNIMIDDGGDRFLSRY